MSVKQYYPEMQDIPVSKFYARYSAPSNKFYVKSKTMPTFKQGVCGLRQLRSDELVEQAQHFVGWYEYRTTEKAFKRLCSTVDVYLEILLD